MADWYHQIIYLKEKRLLQKSTLRLSNIKYRWQCLNVI